MVLGQLGLLRTTHAPYQAFTWVPDNGNKREEDGSHHPQRTPDGTKTQPRSHISQCCRRIGGKQYNRTDTEKSWNLQLHFASFAKVIAPLLLTGSI